MLKDVQAANTIFCLFSTPVPKRLYSDRSSAAKLCAHHLTSADAENHDFKGEKDEKKKSNIVQ